MLLALMNTRSVTPEQKELFASKLYSAIVKELVESNQVYLDVDYHPCTLLSDVAERSGVSKSNFSCKTTMRVEKTLVALKAGYGAKTQILYPNN
ncbi:hypothetical protein D3C71_1455340 [compost metagenome]